MQVRSFVTASSLASFPVFRGPTAFFGVTGELKKERPVYGIGASGGRLRHLSASDEPVTCPHVNAVWQRIQLKKRGSKSRASQIVNAIENPKPLPSQRLLR